MTARRERILGAAEKLFSHYGPAKTTIADIARECGIGVGSVYLDFDSKEAILGELARKKVGAVAEAMRGAAKSERSSERLVELLEARVAALFEVAQGQHGCDLVKCRAAKEERQALAASFGEDVRALLAAEIRRGVASGELGPCEPERAVLLVEVAFVALSPPQVFQFHKRRAVQLARELGEVVVYGLRPRR